MFILRTIDLLYKNAEFCVTNKKNPFLCNFDLPFKNVKSTV